MALGDIQLSCGQASPAAPCPTSPRDNNKGTRLGSTPYNHSRLFVRLINPSCTSTRLALASGPDGLNTPILGDKTPCWNNLDKTIHGFRWAFLLGVPVTQE
ncbi:hypothetical protein FRC12_019174 [Ceratobasidium sp. 428]|nr:hypothetical protein FRC12_019174 [Ceratobasidium sp. 428]